jgi:hypothetical protein
MPKISGTVETEAEFFHSLDDFTQALDAELKGLREDLIREWREWNAGRPDAN